MNQNATRILCFGDSNTWGDIPSPIEALVRRRYPTNVRYAGVLQELLGNDYEVIADGANFRTIKALDKTPGVENRAGFEYYKQCFYANDPLDKIIIFIGTNELKTVYGSTVEQVMQTYNEFVQLVMGMKSQMAEHKTNYIFVLPPFIDDAKGLAKDWFHDGLARSTELRSAMKEYFEKNRLQYIDCFEVNDLGMDGLHLLPEAHHKLAKALFRIIINKNENN